MRIALAIGQPMTPAGAGGNFQLAVPVSPDLDADLGFSFEDAGADDLVIRFEGTRVSIEPGTTEACATVIGSIQACLDFFENRRSSQQLFLDGDWRTAEGGGRAAHDVDEMWSYVRALEGLLPAPYQVTPAIRTRVRVSAERVGEAWTIPRLESLALDDSLRAGRPVILQGVLRDLGWWSFERLCEQFGDDCTHFSRYPDCSYPIADCLGRIVSGDPRAFKAALPLTRALRAHDGVADLLPAGSVFDKARALLVAPADDRMPSTYRATVWHRDWADNLLAELIGVKRVRLASPISEERFSLSATPACHYNVAVDHSPLDPRRADALSGIRVCDAILEPGDVLFIPCGWLHTVDNLTATAALNCWRIRPPEILALKGGPV